MRITEEFTDPCSMATCTLIVEGPSPSFFDPERRSGVQHPGCGHLADVSADLDAFYCGICKWNGRISGAWAIDVLQSVRDAEKIAEHNRENRGAEGGR